MSSILSSQSVVLATAMAVSGTVLLLVFRLQKSLPPQRLPRSCISPDGKKREKKKKRVQFAEDVVEPKGVGEEFRKQQRLSNSSASLKFNKMPANRVALYNGILRDRVVHRVACSY